MPPTVRLVASVMVVAAWLAGACTVCRVTPETGPATIDVSLLTGRPCEPPCWQGLIPDLSTEDDISHFLETSRFVDPDTVFRGDITTGSGDLIGISVQWQSTAGIHGTQGVNSFHIEDGVVRSIETYLDFEVTLEDLLDRYGLPTRLWAQFAPPPSVDAEVTLYYPELGLIARLDLKPSDDHFDLHPESRIERVWYFSPQPLEDLCDLSGAVPFPDKPEHMQIVLQQWQGYGPIELR